MRTVSNQQAERITIVMDDTIFVNCVYTGCKLVFGGGDLHWDNCQFNNCQVQFIGAADRTINFLKAFRLSLDSIGSGTPSPVVAAGNA
jgi:hypothetical protein